MRKNVKKQLALRVLSTAALMAMVSSIATAAFADTYDLNKGSVTVKTKDDGITYVTQENTEINEHPDDTGVTITSGGEKTSNTITVETAKDQTTDVTLKDVNIEVNTSEAKTGAIEIKGDGDTNLELNGDNTVLTTNSTAEEHAAIEKADAYGTGTLTIKDDVNDDGTAKTGTEADTTGTLLAGGYHMAAAIGGGSLSYREDSLANTSNITITGGDITAVAGEDSAAAIGGGCDGTGKNIRIEGNAHVTALAQSGAGIGGGTGGGNSITITDDAVVNARSYFDAAIGGGDDAGRYNSPNTITISGNATVTAESDESSAIGDGRYGNASDLTINIEKNANVTAISSGDHPAIGTPRCIDAVTTTINITGGTVNAINSVGSDYPSYPNDGTGDHSPAIGAVIIADRGATCNVNINSSTGDTVVNAYIYGKGSGTAIGSTTETPRYNPYNVEYQYVPADSVSYNADGSSHFGEINSAIVNCYNNATVEKKELDNLPTIKDTNTVAYFDYSHTIHGGTLTKVVHNRKYMEEHPEIVDITKLKDEDLHDWKLVGEVVQPTLEKEGYADYICSIDKCGQTKRVKLPKLTPEPSEPDTPSTPETPDTPDTPNKPDVPSTPEVTPDAPAQDGTAPADTLAADTTADAAVVPADAQNMVQDAKPEAAAPAAAAVLPQTGANWLAVVGSALSGLFLLAAGFVLDRKNRRMN